MYSLAPAIAAGNTIVVKPSEHASASVVETLRLAEEAGFSPGVFNVVTGAGETGAALVDHLDVAKISFTAATRPASTSRAARAARARDDGARRQEPEHRLRRRRARRRRGRSARGHLWRRRPEVRRRLPRAAAEGRLCRAARTRAEAHVVGRAHAGGAQPRADHVPQHGVDGVSSCFSHPLRARM
jgi:hypothetical protein